jgi:hypothetical protein
MMKAARWHTMIGLTYAIVGMLVGIYMATSQNHTQHVTHAHILLLGLVVSLLYGMVYRLWLPDAPSGLAMVQLVLHQLGTLFISAGLFILYGQILPEPTIGPVLGVASIAVLLGAILMWFLFARRAMGAAPAPAKSNWSSAPEH